MQHIIVFIVFFIISCQPAEQRIPKDFDPGLNPSVKIGRFEQELFAVDTFRLEYSLERLIRKYPGMSRIFFEGILNWTKNVDSLEPIFISRAANFFRDRRSYELLDMTNAKYRNLLWLEEELAQSCGLCKYYFPEFQTPNFYTLISGFNVGNFIFEDEDKKDGLGIGLDFFIGPEYNYSTIDPSNPAFSNYLTRTFNKDHMLKKTWEIWVEDKLGAEPGDKLLDYIIHRGKRQYILSRIIPEIQDSVLFEYSSKEIKWCNENRRAIWSYFTGENLLFENNSSKIQKYIHPSPDSPGMPSLAPGQTGTYIGYYIIESYMRRNPATKLPDLIKETDSQKILELSKFKPKDG
ncbi:MAG: hypothetical protein IPO62_07785 [Saprospiraceae bacterium]|nr:hypothetical protein [Saprospiraceae bacterium]